jgi:hypothetical protein
MKWDRSETLALASIRCPYCMGLGLCRGRGGAHVPCVCVLRAIFRACFSRFRHGAVKTRGAPVVNVDRKECGQRRGNFGWRAEEYGADFYLMCKRTLTASEWRIFWYAYLLGADWELCHARLNMERDDFTQACRNIEAKLGRVFRETRPYSLFPLDAYFSPSKRGVKVIAFPAKAPIKARPVRPPLAA